MEKIERNYLLYQDKKMIGDVVALLQRPNT